MRPITDDVRVYLAELDWTLGKVVLTSRSLKDGTVRVLSLSYLHALGSFCV